VTEIQGGNPGITYLLLVLDASSSMYESAAALVQGVNALVEEQKRNGHDEIHIGYTTFGYEAQVYPIDPVETLPRFGSLQRPYSATGMTALRDGIGKTIKAAQVHIRNLPPHQRPGRVTLVVQTDGDENQSRMRAATVKDLIKGAKAEGWEFLYVGEGSYSAPQGARLGFDRILTYEHYELPQMVSAVSLASVALRTGVDLPRRVMKIVDLQQWLASQHVGGLT
jgi:Mg-chelatase subunit ChlD